MSIGQRLHLRLFVEGVEVPVISAQIQSQDNTPVACSIQIPANDYAMDFKPRTLIHLFMYDIYGGTPPAEMVSIGGPGIRVEDRDDGVDPDLMGLFPPERWESTPEQDLTDLENENYKLVFGGEVMGIQYSKQPASRSMVLQCLDWSSYWDIAYQYMVSGMSLGGGGIRAAFTGASTTVFNSFLDGSGDIVVRLMRTPPRNYPNLRNTLLGALTHIIEAMGGVYFGPRAMRGVNDFFSLAEMRLHITQMLAANPFSNRDEVRLMNANGFGGLFGRSLSGLGKLVTIRQILMALQRYIFHDIIPINAPRYIPPLYDPNLPRYEDSGLEDDPATRPLSRVATQIKSRADELKERQESSTDAESARRQSNRRGGLKVELRRLSRLCVDAERRARRVGIGGVGSVTDFFSIHDVSRAFAVCAASFTQLADLTRRGQRDVSTNIFLTAVTPDAGAVVAICTQISALMQQVLTSRHRKRIRRTSTQPDPPPRLVTQIYRPDVWMVAPPRCNVFFPELYSQFTYGRNFMAETSRLLLRTSSAFFGSDILFDGFYMSPSRVLGARSGRRLSRGRTGIDPPDLADAPAWVVRDMMDHELFTGIVPAFERMTDLNLHALRGGYTEVNGVRIGYAQLAANHIFFQYRFKSRDLQLTGKFNPYAVLGFPCLVVDKYLPQDYLREGDYDSAVAARIAESVREGEGDVGSLPEEERQRVREASWARVAEVSAGILEGRPNTHYLGTPALVTHLLDAASGGSTQVQMKYARTTNERMEFMGDNVQRGGSRARRTRNVRVTTVVACINPPGVDVRGPRGGQIISATDVTDRYTRRQRRLRTTNRTATGLTRYEGGTRLPLFVPDRAFTGRRRIGTTVLVGVEQPASSYGAEVVALVGGAGGQFDAATQEIQVTFRAYSLIEEVGAYTLEDVEMAPEDLVFPPWYGENYRTSQIGGLYSYYFGIGSITDPLVVVEPGVEPTTSAMNQDPEAQARTLSVAYIRRFSDVVRSALQSSGVSSPDQPPQPGFSDTPELQAGEFIGPPGDAEADARGDADGRLGEIRARGPIAEATEEIVRIYSQVKTRNFDVHQFIRAYTWRPIASMVDLFGTANLEISDSGEVLRGVEGFHSRAFGDFDDLRQLVGPGSGDRPRTIMGLSITSPDETSASDDRNTNIAARMDTRKEKRLQVFRYLYALMASRGILG